MLPKQAQNTTEAIAIILKRARLKHPSQMLKILAIQLVAFANHSFL